MSHTEYSAQFVQYSSVFLGLEEALPIRVSVGSMSQNWENPFYLAMSLFHRAKGVTQNEKRSKTECSFSAI